MSYDPYAYMKHKHATGHFKKGVQESLYALDKIAAALYECETGKKITDICSKHAIGLDEFKQWRKQYSGLDGQQLRNQLEMEKESERIKENAKKYTMY